MTGDSEYKIVDHLFRHQYGKMVAVLSKIFGLSHLELIEDAVQDTFLKASLSWRKGMPDNPQAWLMRASRNRVVDLLRKLGNKRNTLPKLHSGALAYEINEQFLDQEISDSQLRMIFVACHPAFSQLEQIAFALKTVSGFSQKEIAAALLTKEETIKKRLQRARKKIQKQDIRFDFPDSRHLQSRMDGVLQVIYLIFNEGFHTSGSGFLINKDLCGEALRLCKLLLVKENFRSGSLYALFGLLCLHASRIEARIKENEVVALKDQNRKHWYKPLINMGKDALIKAETYPEFSSYHLEALIALEHIKAPDYQATDWKRILELYEKLFLINPSDALLLSRAAIHLQTSHWEKAKKDLDSIDPEALNQRRYLYFACLSEYYLETGNNSIAIAYLDKAIANCPGTQEREFFNDKRKKLSC